MTLQNGVQHGTAEITVNGEPVSGNILPVQAAGTTVQIRVRMG